MHIARWTLALPVLLILSGCPLTHASPPARAQEAATELNTHSRFGRMELAVARVTPDLRETFLARRRAWGAMLRVADYEVTGFSMKGYTDAETVVKVAWYRINESDLRTTVIRQSWHDFKGDWQLTAEARVDGDKGLIDDGPPIAESPSTGSSKAKNVHFPTIHLGRSDPQKANEPASPDATDQTGSP